MKNFSNIKTKIVQIYKNILYLNKKINPSLLASSITFYLILTLIPLMELIYLLLSSLEVIDNYSKIYNPTFTTTIIFIINLLITSSKLVHNLAVVTDEVYFNVKDRSRLMLRIRSFFLTIVFLTLILIMIVSVIYIGYLKTTFFIEYGFIINLFQFFLTHVFISLFLSVLYKMITPVKMRINETFIPSVVISLIIYVLVVLYQNVIRGILINKYEIIYGSFASIITTLVFLYIASYIFIIGICFLLYKKEYK